MWTIELVKTAILHSPGPEVFFQRDFTRCVELAIFSFILRSGSRTVLVDTGLGEHAALNADVRSRKGEWSGFQVVAPQPAVLDALLPDDIVLTTFGPYAIGGLERWLSARVHYSARGFADLEAHEVPLFKRSLPPGFVSRLGGEGGHPVSGRRGMREGLELIELGAHSPSAMGLIVNTADGVVAIADPIFHAENLTRGIPLGWLESMPEWYDMFRKLGSSVGSILPIHDPSGKFVAKSEWHPDLVALANHEVGGEE